MNMTQQATGTFEVTMQPQGGPGSLAGIADTLKINIEGGKHFYEFEYSLATSQ